MCFCTHLLISVTVQGRDRDQPQGMHPQILELRTTLGNAAKEWKESNQSLSAQVIEDLHD